MMQNSLINQKFIKNKSWITKPVQNLQINLKCKFHRIRKNQKKVLEIKTLFLTYKKCKNKWQWWKTSDVTMSLFIVPNISIMKKTAIRKTLKLTKTLKVITKALCIKHKMMGATNRIKLCIVDNQTKQSQMLIVICLIVTVLLMKLI